MFPDHISDISEEPNEIPKLERKALDIFRDQTMLTFSEDDIMSWSVKRRVWEQELMIRRILRMKRELEQKKLQMKTSSDSYFEFSHEDSISDEDASGSMNPDAYKDWVHAACLLLTSKQDLISVAQMKGAKKARAVQSESEARFQMRERDVAPESASLERHERHTMLSMNPQHFTPPVHHGPPSSNLYESMAVQGGSSSHMFPSSAYPSHAISQQQPHSSSHSQRISPYPSQPHSSSVHHPPIHPSSLPIYRDEYSTSMGHSHQSYTSSPHSYEYGHHMHPQSMPGHHTSQPHSPANHLYSSGRHGSIDHYMSSRPVNTSEYARHDTHSQSAHQVPLLQGPQLSGDPFRGSRYHEISPSRSKMPINHGFQHHSSVAMKPPSQPPTGYSEFSSHQVVGHGHSSIPGGDLSVPMGNPFSLHPHRRQGSDHFSDLSIQTSSSKSVSTMGFIPTISSGQPRGLSSFPSQHSPAVGSHGSSNSFQSPTFDLTPLPSFPLTGAGAPGKVSSGHW
ncbi:hypothetical protein ADUPG1_008350 [Aduncisulcus paluster]|uniref:Uncharacterized protein n=1 Tax=Aduncisulcus paluster TaxID=2918883 RepID=A0ABQ5KU41_9EUKA|nr:hypothetical protein ADUPG1_008350 [Aduncisulcus paluster]